MTMSFVAVLGISRTILPTSSTNLTPAVLYRDCSILVIDCSFTHVYEEGLELGFP
ncbi:hypothetical protein M6B38_118610 [Iris pallida]|uniref:Uncharacterized protein n=1 Tax=Iris pallida TaxID=29817 RepID=A0AAX6HJH1_IRIPA|nr:hypothetical protein M6B38_118610 [Iris pallida]